MLRGVVSQETNDRAMEYCDEHAGDVPLEEEWFRQNVTLNPALTGVVRSLLGSNFSYFSFSASHRNIGPNIAQNWHRDGGSIYSPKMDCLQVFYLPQLTTLEMVPHGGPARISSPLPKHAVHVALWGDPWGAP